MTRLRAGIIGLGVGRQHIEGYARHPACEVVALCDLAEDKLALARREYPRLKITPHAADILEDPGIDVVSIASYDDCHHEQVASAIRHDKHVFVEKPLCLREEQADELRSLLRTKPGLRLSSNLILRMCPRFRWLREQVRGGRLGRLFHAEGDYNYGRLHKITDGWRGRIEGYSVVLGGAVHLVDLLLWLTGDEPVEVAACGNRIASAGTAFRHHDFVAGLLRFRSGMLAKVSANFGCVHPHFHNVVLYGTQATFINGRESGLLFESRDPDTPPRAITAAYPGTHKGDLIHSFIESIVGGAPAEVTADDVFRTMSVCFAIEKAARQGQFVPVRYN